MLSSVYISLELTLFLGLMDNEITGSGTCIDSYEREKERRGGRDQEKERGRARKKGRHRRGNHVGEI